MKLSTFLLTALLTTTATSTTSVKAAPTDNGPKFLIESLLYGIPTCVRRCVEESLPIGGCDGDKDQVIGCLCSPQAQAQMQQPVMECVRRKRGCRTEDVLAAESRAVYSCQLLGFISLRSFTTTPLTDKSHPVLNHRSF
ncbi:hypothetical protein TWF718_002553 [Orbilia javanica]|uniref:CFEM domain-containing protein n=1 Tax=Orbilia javanica TaxID=47235 RepID=A0AAN8MG42_9PEZI